MTSGRRGEYRAREGTLVETVYLIFKLARPYGAVSFVRDRGMNESK